MTDKARFNLKLDAEERELLSVMRAEGILRRVPPIA